MDISDNLKNFPTQHKQHYSLIQKKKQTTEEGHKHINTFYIFFANKKLIRVLIFQPYFFNFVYSYFSEVIFKTSHTVRIYYLPLILMLRGETMLQSIALYEKKKNNNK